MTPIISTPTKTLAALAIALTPFASAEPYHHTFELHGGVGRTLFGGDMDDSTHYNLGLGVNLGDRWGVELMASDLDTEFNDNRNNINPDLDIEQYRIDAVYHVADRNQQVRPYFAFGAGNQEMSGPSLSEDQDDTLINAGAGIKYQFANHWQWRTDIRLFNNIDEHESDVAFSTGISLTFGGQPSRSAPPPAPEPADSDNDGVNDSRDQCPNTPQGVRVDANGCALDSDNDGVPDHRDDCPNTAPQYRVDDKGCPIELTESVSIEMQVQFAIDSADVPEQYHSEVQKVADFMHQFDETRVRVEGHSDSTGAADYNQQLSQRRAESVRQVLIEHFDLSADRVEAVGYGEERPIANNETAEGREQNRRVVGEISADVSRPLTRD